MLLEVGKEGEKCLRIRDIKGETIRKEKKKRKRLSSDP